MSAIGCSCTASLVHPGCSLQRRSSGTAAAGAAAASSTLRGPAAHRPSRPALAVPCAVAAETAPTAAAAVNGAAATATSPLGSPPGAGGPAEAAAAAPRGQSSRTRRYPHIEAAFPGLELVHEEPPVYIVRQLLSADDCRLLRRAAEAGRLPGLQYDNSVLLDTHRLWPLLAVIAAGAGFDAWRELQAGGGGGSLEAAAAAAAPALARWALGVGGLLAGALAAARLAIGGKVFTGTKWTTTRLEPAHPAAPAVASFLAATCALLAAPPDRLEPPTVTRYRQGQYQRMHFDARPDGDTEGLKQYDEAGGQRLVQVVAYLNTLDEDRGGGTRFHHPLFRGLTVQPSQGDALVFFPATADGRFDERMAHSGLPVLAGEKWILNTWACQRSVPTAVAHLPLPLPPGPVPRSAALER